ncbi:hypothetical protein L218DRAFT_1005672 [Marasmius fiardii PR-910]|nr:hypothetical protein L218DRAFT_1005672 [Marasmius fiardii PR-910]
MISTTRNRAESRTDSGALAIPTTSSGTAQSHSTTPLFTPTPAPSPSEKDDSSSSSSDTTTQTAMDNRSTSAEVESSSVPDELLYRQDRSSSSLSTGNSLFNERDSSSEPIDTLSRGFRPTNAPTRSRIRSISETGDSSGVLYDTPSRNFSTPSSISFDSNQMIRTSVRESNEQLSSPEINNPDRRQSRPLPGSTNPFNTSPPSGNRSESIIRSTDDRSTSIAPSEQFRAFYENLRRMYILQYARNQDLSRHSTSLIPNQQVIIEEGTCYSPEFPLVKLSAYPLASDDWKFIRDQYPEPFSPNDPVVQRRPINSNTARREGNVRFEHRDSTPDLPEDSSIGSNESRKEYNGRKGTRHNSPNNNSHAPSGGGPPDGGPPGGGGPPSDDGNDPDETDSGEEMNQFTNRNNRRSGTSERSQTIFGQTRYSSADITFSEKETFVYDPTPLTEAEVLRAAFRQFEDLITFQLFPKASDMATSNLRKNVLQSIPKPGFYYGDNNDYLAFDMWIRSIIRWLALAGLCGPELRWSTSRNTWVLTSVDMQRTNVLGTLLKEDAATYFTDKVERIPSSFDRNNPLQGRKTFMEVVSGLYQRFIHDTSLTYVTEQLDDVRYTISGGIKNVFSSMVNFAKCMPNPPDSYTFKRKLIWKVPQSMRDQLLDIHGITAESSTVNEIIQAILACERSMTSKKYYSRIQDDLKRSRRRRSRSRSKERKRREQRDKGKQKERSPSPHRLQVVDRRRYQVKPNSRRDNGRPDWSRKMSNSNDKEKRNEGTEDKKNTQSSGNRMYRMIDSKGKERLFQMIDGSNSEPDSSTSEHDPVSNEEAMATMNSDSEFENIDNCGGSQYSSEADEHCGFMREDCSSINE